MSEGLVRRLGPFADFLGAAALSDTELVNAANVGRECGVSASTAREYFQILIDTLLARWLPAYVKRPKRRVVLAPKFYFADVGVVNVLARRGHLEPGSELFGRSTNPGHAIGTWSAASPGCVRPRTGLSFFPVKRSSNGSGLASSLEPRGQKGQE